MVLKNILLLLLILVGTITSRISCLQVKEIKVKDDIIPVVKAEINDLETAAASHHSPYYDETPNYHSSIPETVYEQYNGFNHGPTHFEQSYVKKPIQQQPQHFNYKQDHHPKKVVHQHHQHEKVIHRHHHHQHILHQHHVHNVYLNNTHLSKQHVHEHHLHKQHIHEPVYHVHPHAEHKVTEEHRHKHTHGETHAHVHKNTETHVRAPPIYFKSHVGYGGLGHGVGNSYGHGKGTGKDLGYGVSDHAVGLSHGNSDYDHGH